MADKAANIEQTEKKFSRVKQTDVPVYPLDQAIKIAEALSNEYAKKATKPLHIAAALGIKPQSSHFRILTGSALAYGITNAAYNAELIDLTPLGKRIVAPTTDGDDLRAMREAFLRPRIIKEFAERYNGSRLPTDKIALNVLEEMGVAHDRTEKVLVLIKEGLESLKLVKSIKGENYVDLSNDLTNKVDEVVKSGEVLEENVDGEEIVGDEKIETDIKQHIDITNKKVFITHGKNKGIVDQLKELLTFGKFEPVISVERETTAIPVPQKVLDDMRGCSAAIIHVGTELNLIDDKGNPHKMLNQNVLIEIGAAMALYGKKFILLVEDGVTLPSNLQGLYEVRYQGEKLDYDATMKLLKAFNEFSN